jgi:murein L,D-transpeptidase YafK
MIRVFKRESELEVWMLKEGRFQLYALHRICYWSGRLGPKEREGDRQAPEGFYAVSLGQLHHV